MATMHPPNLKSIHFAADSEEYVYNILKDSLPKKTHVFYSVRWNTIQEHDIHMGEGDFIIVDPDFGFLVIEVKGGAKIQFSNGEWILWDNMTEKRVLSKSPYDQANTNLWAFKNSYREKYDEELHATHGYAVMFPYYNVPFDLSCDMNEGNTIIQKDFAQLKRKINSVFHSWCRLKNPWLSKETFDRLISLFEGETYNKISPHAICRMNLRELSSMNYLQSTCINMLFHYKQALIVGSAGTGKTYMAIEKAKEYDSYGNKTLFVCYNRLACQNVKNKLIDTNVECHTFHSLVRSLLGHDSYEKLISAGYELKGLLNDIDFSSIVKYEAIVVDEAQDFMEEWAMVIKSLLRDQENGNLYVFYDEEQNIFNRNFGEAFFISSPPFLLRRNLRNTGTIWDWLTDKTGLGVNCTANEVQGIDPILYKAKNNTLAINQIQKRILEAINENVDLKNIIILSDRKKDNSILSSIIELVNFPIVECDEYPNMHKNSISYYTIQSYKGLEADIVICLISKNANAEMRYVAYSRARCLLYVVEY